MFSALVAGAQTNSVKGSAEPSASSLTGAESVLVIQGGTTKLSNVAAIQAAPFAAIGATNTALAASIAAVAASVTATTSGLQTQITANATTATTSSNALQTLITANTARDTATTNGLQAQITANATAAAAANLATSNAIQGIANAAAAQVAATGITNGGAANFGVVTYSVMDLGSVTDAATVVVSGGLSTLQKVLVTATGNGQRTITTALTNLAAGQNFSLLVSRAALPGSATCHIALPAGTINLNSGAATTVDVAAGKSLILNFTSYGTTLSTVVMSASASQ